MKKLSSISLLLVVLVLGMTSCMDMGSGGGNSSSFTLPAVVSYNMSKGGTTLLTVAGEFSAPELASAFDLQPGDCVAANVTIDLDNQPSKDYYTATRISYNLIDQSVVDIREEWSIADFYPIDSILPIKEIGLYDYDPVLRGKFFLQTAYASIKQEITYKMIAQSNDVPSDKEVTDVYLFAIKGNTTTVSSSGNIYAFDILNAISALGKDATIKISSVEYNVKQLTVNLKYCSGIDKEGVPVYTEYKPSSTPLTLAVYK